jgi:hypothetical protein
MTNDMPVLEAMSLSVRNEVYIDVFGLEAMIVTGCRIGTKACMTVEFAEGNTGNYDVDSTSTVKVVRVVS